MAAYLFGNRLKVDSVECYFLKEHCRTFYNSNSRPSASFSSFSILFFAFCSKDFSGKFELNIDDLSNPGNGDTRSAQKDILSEGHDYIIKEGYANGNYNDDWVGMLYLHRAQQFLKIRV